MNHPDIGGFGVPYPPFGYNSQMDMIDVPRDEAEQLGLLEPGQPVEAPQIDFNDQLKHSIADLDPDQRAALLASLGPGNAKILRDEILWNPKKSPSQSSALWVKPAPEDHLAAIVPKWYVGQNAIQKQLDDLLKRIDTLNSMTKTPEIDKALHECFDKRVHLGNLKERRFDKMTALIFNSIAKPAPGTHKFDTSLFTDIPQFSLSHIEGLNDFLNKITGPQYSLPDTIKTFFEPELKRSYFDLNDGTIHLARSISYIHETGHALEYAFPDIAQRSEQFLRDRIAKGYASEMEAAYKEYDGKIPQILKDDILKRYSIRRLSEINPKGKYRDDEIGWQDKFINEYSGKDYPGATEILSTGLEQLYINPMKFIEEDPDYFKFVIRTLKGVKHDVNI